MSGSTGRTSRAVRRILIPCCLAAGLLLAACSSFNVHRARVAREHLGDLLYVERSGSGDPVVVLPGLMGSTRYWAHAGFDTLAPSRTVIFVDELGFGKSPWPDVGYTLDDHLGALRRTLVREGATSRVTIVAHSFGTILASYYAARYPEEVDRLYLLGTPVFRTPAEARERMAAMSFFAALYSRSRALAMLACVMQDALQPAAIRLAPRVMRDMPAEVAEDGTLHFWPSLDGSIRNVILSRPIEEPLRVIGSRVTFIHGHRDPVTPMTRLREVASAIGARLIEVQGDHGSYVGEATTIVKQELMP